MVFKIYLLLKYIYFSTLIVGYKELTYIYFLQSDCGLQRIDGVYHLHTGKSCYSRYTASSGIEGFYFFTNQRAF